ncbi:hypothetical protein CC2G_001914 [Coprinopsis cinerea AmutBmut pab1-1]|nr:hypothetical protein CC2G_001914 [Coprinopsis cinerea AmutBmut pab1-1]
MVILGKLATELGFAENRIVISKAFEIALKDEDSDVRRAAVESLTLICKDLDQAQSKEEIRELLGLTRHLETILEASDPGIPWPKLAHALYVDNGLDILLLPSQSHMAAADFLAGILNATKGNGTSFGDEFLKKTLDKGGTLRPVDSDGGMIRKAWAKAIASGLSHSKNDTYHRDSGLERLADLAFHDPHESVRFTVIHLLSDLAERHEFAMQFFVKLFESPRYGLQVSNDKSLVVRLAWIKALSTLPIDLHSPFAIGIVYNLHDALGNARSTLVSLFTGDDDEDVRLAAAEALQNLLEVDKGNVWKTLSDILSKAFEASLNGPNHLCRLRVIDTMRAGLSIQNSQFRFPNLLKGLASSLLQAAMRNEGTPVQRAAEHFLLDLINAKALPADTTIDLLYKMQECATGPIIDGGSTIVFKVIENLSNVLHDNGALLNTARSLTPKLMSYTQSSRRFIDEGSAKSRLTVALKDPYDDNRLAALELLVELCQEVTFEQIPAVVKAGSPQFLALLQRRDLRTPAVELISLLSQDDRFREKVASWVVSSLVQNEHPPYDAAELLANLVVCGRLRDSSHNQRHFDYILLLLASVLTSNPEASMERFQFSLVTGLHYYFGHGASSATGLRCLKTSSEDAEKNGGEVVQEVAGPFPDDLVDWFMAALFGPHTTQNEVDDWLETEKYL